VSGRRLAEIPMAKKVTLRGPRGGWDLAIIGTGVSGEEQLTLEACSYLSNARIAYCLPCCPAEWRMFRALNKRAVNLFRTVYRQGSRFSDAYAEIERVVISSAKEDPGVVYAIPGNPVFYAFPVQRLLDRADDEGLRVVVRSGVSSFDLILAALRLEVGMDGAQLYNALDAESKKPPLNVRAHCFFFQVGVLGLDAVDQRRGRAKRDVGGFVDYLKGFYPSRHRCLVIMIEPGGKGLVDAIGTTIGGIAAVAGRLHIGHTLYIPPIG
jgi:precorrin-6B methylase 1